MLQIVRRSTLAALAYALLVAAAVAQDDVADVPSQDLHIGENVQQRYFLIGPLADAKPSADGFGLILVLPGGNGSADFNPFVKRIYKNAVPEGYLVAQLVAIPWDPKIDVTWPTAKDRVARAKFTTEAFVDAVINDVSARHKVNPARIMTLSWSSGGPAAYAISLSNPRVRGSLVAMSIFRPTQLPALDKARGQAYYLYHSPDDQVCRYSFAQQAVKTLGENGAKVKLMDYSGGHGWRGNIYGDLRAGVKWLEENVTK